MKFSIKRCMESKEDYIKNLLLGGSDEKIRLRLLLGLRVNKVAIAMPTQTSIVIKTCQFRFFI